MSTDQEPTYSVKLAQLLLLSTYWGMQIWVTFISSEHTPSRPHGPRGLMGSILPE